MTNTFPKVNTMDTAAGGDIEGVLGTKYYIIASGMGGSYQGLEGWLLRPRQGDDRQVLLVTRYYGSCCWVCRWRRWRRIVMLDELYFAKDQDKKANVIKEMTDYVNDQIKEGQPFASVEAAAAWITARIAGWRRDESGSWVRIPTPKPGDQDECRIGDPYHDEVEMLGGILDKVLPLLKYLDPQ